ncbi:GNAT family N-acetyltransferase [Yunchengibacter salinarum]|uniref:GNAT family N-acetyltransferase n=1 Tax=Yunchengibacter salinarum TaxID=3133399 RepID=UPI0035B57E71
MPATILLEPVQAADLPQVRALLARLALDEGRPDVMTADERALARLFLDGASPAEAFMVRRQGRDVGLVVTMPAISTFRGMVGLHLEDVVLAPEARGMGLGRAVMAAVARLAQARGAAFLDWSAVAANTGAQAFYRALGCRADGDTLLYRLDRAGLDALAEDAI